MAAPTGAVVAGRLLESASMTVQLCPVDVATGTEISYEHDLSPLPVAVDRSK